MTPISDVFMLSIDSKLDYNTLTKVCGTGHSRIPVYEEVDVLVSSIAPNGTITPGSAREQPRTQRVKKIVGILLVKQCVLLDPKGNCLNINYIKLETDVMVPVKMPRPFATFVSTRFLSFPTTSHCWVSWTNFRKVEVIWQLLADSASKRSSRPSWPNLPC
jgi:hypothetical protein